MRALLICVVILLNSTAPLSGQVRRNGVSPTAADTEPLVARVAPRLPDSGAASMDSLREAAAAGPERTLARWTVVLGVATVIVAFGSLATLYFLFGQGKELQAQRRVSELQAKHLADHTAALKEHATYLKASVDLMGDTTRRQLRAYLVVAVKSIKPNRFGVPVLTLMIRNRGQTPAYRVNITSNFQVLAHNTAKTLTFPCTTGQASGAGTVGGGGRGEFVHGAPVRIETDLDLALRGEAIYVWGTVRYFDVFNVARHTNYCMTASWNERDDKFLLMQTEFGNGTEESE